MNVPKRILLFGTISFVLVFAGLSVSRLLLENNLPLADSIVSNLLIIFGINLIILMLFGLPRFQTLSTQKRLTVIGWTAGVFLIFSLVLNIIMPGVITTDYYDLIRSGSEPINVITVSALVYFALLLASLLFLQLYGMILINQKKRTRLQFWFLYAVILTFLVFSSITKLNPFSTGIPSPESLFEIITLAASILIIFLIVTNSYRNSWVNYLNKKQKIITLLTGIFIIVMLILVEELPGQNLQITLLTYSHSSGVFFSIIRLFFLIYSLMAIISLILHLPTAGIFDRKVRQLTSLFHVSNAISTSMNTEKFLNMITDKTLEVVGANSSWLMMSDTKTTGFKLGAFSQVPKEILEKIKRDKFSPINNWLVETKKPLVLHQLLQVKTPEIGNDIRTIGGSLIAMPLLKENKNVAGIIFAWKETEFGFDEEDREMIQAYANQTVIAIDNITHIEQRIERQRLQQELDVAREIQLKLLPKEIPVLSEEIEIEAISIPANEVGGDYYDFIKLDENKWGIYIGDVSGKSISAALYMAEIKGFIQSLAKLYFSPRDLMIKINETLYGNIDRKSFITMIAAVIDLEKGELKYSRAGHAPLGYFNPDDEEWNFFQPMGLGLGLDKGDVFNKVITEETIKYKPGSVFYLYTDGVTEVFDINDEEFGENRLQELLYKCKKENKTSYIDTILNKIDTFSNSRRLDDVTMIVVKLLETEIEKAE
ncbi:MAG: SpoIIE family protein phosphatase [bacterium]|nr:SpoIIE family protein phosphatase [bacterium]